MNSIEKFKVDSRIIISYYKHRGNISVVSEELDIDFDYVKRITDKLKKKIKRDVSVYVADGIMQAVLMGYEQRTSHLNECLNKLRGVEEADVSVCCRYPVRKVVEGEEEVSYCLKCAKRTHTCKIPVAEVFRLIREFTQELRGEDRFMVEFAEKMGFTVREPAPVVHQNIAVFSGGANVAGQQNLSEETRVLVADIDRMDPRSRERVRKEFEKTVMKEKREKKERK